MLVPTASPRLLNVGTTEVTVHHSPNSNKKTEMILKASVCSFFDIVSSDTIQYSRRGWKRPSLNQNWIRPNINYALVAD